VKAVEKQSASA